MLPKLLVRIGADTDEFKAGLDRAKKMARQFGKAVAAATAAATAATVALTARSLQQVDAQAKLARSIGISTASLQAMSMVASEAGVNQEQLAAALSSMQRRVTLGGEALKKLGIDIQAIGKMAPEDQFEAIAAELAKIEDPTKRSAAAMEVFGESGRRITGMLEDFGARADEARAFQERFGIAVSDVDAAAIEQANDAMGRIGEALRGIGNMVATYVAPLIKGLVDRFFDLSIEADDFRHIGSFALGVVGRLVDGIRIAVIAVAAAFNAVKAGVLLFGSAALQGLQPVAEVMDQISRMGGGQGGMGASVGATAESLRAAAEDANADFNAALDNLRNFESTADAIERIRAEVLADLRDPDNVAPGLGDAVNRSMNRGAVAGLASPADLEKELADRLARVVEGLQTETETLEAWYEDGRATLQEALNNRLLDEQAFLEARQRLEEEYASRAEDIEKRRADNLAKIAGDGADKIASNVVGAASALFEQSKPLAAAQAIINTYQGITEALKLPPPGNFAAAALVAAQGFAAVRGIFSTSPGSGAPGAAGGAGGGGGVAAAPAALQVQANFQGDTFSRAQVQQGVTGLFDQLSDEAKRRGLRLTVAA